MDFSCHSCTQLILVSGSQCAPADTDADVDTDADIVDVRTELVF